MGTDKEEELKTIRLTTPITDDDIQGLALGNIVYLDGLIYTAREGVYKRILEDKVEAPVDLRSLTNVNFHCSPAAAPDSRGGYTVGAVTATASFRFSKWMRSWFELSGARLVIGKGGMSQDDYRNLFVPVGAAYLTTVGYGTGALLGRGIKSVRSVYWLEELGIAQAMWVFEVENMGPFLVESDAVGNSLFERNNQAINANFEALYAGLKKPALRRFGETDDRTDELI